MYVCSRCGREASPKPPDLHESPEAIAAQLEYPDGRWMDTAADQLEVDSLNGLCRQCFDEVGGLAYDLEEQDADERNYE